MWGYLICFVSLLGVLLVNGQTTSPTICWDSTWYNNSAPTAANRSDYETQPTKVLDTICSIGKVIAARCKDVKGEAFTTLKNDTVSKYIATCDVVTGLICNPYKKSNVTCPDFEIQYGCTCPTTMASGGTSAPSGGGSKGAVGSSTAPRGGTGNGASTTSPGAASGSAGQQHGQCGNGVQRREISQFVLIICVILKMFG